MVDYLENMRKLRKENKGLTLELKLREEMSKKYRSILKDAWGNNEGVMNEVRRNIARIQTVITEKARA